jgi:hypothetical protein
VALSTSQRQYIRVYMRDYRRGMRRSRRYYEAIIDLARREHDTACGCKGERCLLGGALAKVP